MFKYAQIDETGRCHSVTFLTDLENEPHLILLGDDDDVRTGDILTAGVWSRPSPPPPVPSDVDVLKEEVTFLKQRDSKMQDDITAIIEGLTGGV